MKQCELCDLPARAFCASDQASLCWTCDSKVHSANFLVARHSRSLLCHICQSTTPWKAQGPKLGSTVSLCEKCVGNGQEERDESQGGNDYYDEEDDDDESFDDTETDSESDCVDEEDEENQVVPWTSSTASPRVVSTSSSTVAIHPFPLKRFRQNADLVSNDDIDCSSSEPKARDSADDEVTSIGTSVPRKHQKTCDFINRSDERGSVIIDSLRKLQQLDVLAAARNNSPTFLDICIQDSTPTD